MSKGMEESSCASLQSRAITEAMDWFTRHRGGDLSEAEKQAFIEWLRASPIHTSEYLAAARIAQDLPVVAARLRSERPTLLVQAGTSPESNVLNFEKGHLQEAFARSEARWPRGVRWLAAAVVFMMALGGALLWALGSPGLSGLPRVVSVSHGEQRTVQLRDGSVAHLNTDTRIRVRYTQGARLIEFERGQALFQVARDAARPFRVRAGETEVLAVGTQFELYRKTSGEMLVTVVEGVVDVRRNVSSSSHSGLSAMRLGAGEQARIGSAIPATKARDIDVRAATAWVQRELVFSEQSLRDVAIEFGRYNTVPIAIEDPALRELQVSGIFKAYDVESFLGFLRQFEGVEIERDAEVIHVRRRDSARR
jgi:transmembrane sensor